MVLCRLIPFLLSGMLMAAPAVKGTTQKVGNSPQSGGYKTVVAGGMHYMAFTQGFPASHSIWSSLGVTPDDKVVVGVSDHGINSGLFKYDAVKDTMTYLGDVLGNGKMWLHQWQGKIHTRIDYNPRDGLMYFGTDAGNDLWEGAGTSSHEFVGGYWFSIDLKTDKVQNLGMGVRYMGLKSICIDPKYNRIFSTTDPNSHLIIYDVDKGKSPVFDVYKTANKDYGCINGTHEPRMIWCDKWGNAYTVNEIGQLTEFVGATGEIKRLNNTVIPYAKGTQMWQVGSGASAIVDGPNRDFVYGITYYGRLFKHIPEEKGEGRIEDLGNGVLKDSSVYDDKAKVGNLALGLNGKLYYTIGGHGSFITADSTAILFEFDPITKKKTQIYKFEKIVSECTGGCTDSKGNIYYGAHGQSLPGAGEAALRKPYLVKFHPDKLERLK